MTEGITPKQFHDSEGVEDWRVIGDGACAYFRTGSFAASARLVQAISQLPGVEDHKTDVDLRHDGVTVRLITYTDDYYGMSQRDVEHGPPDLGGCPTVGPVCRPVGRSEPARHPGRDLHAEVMPFWRAALGYEPRRDSPAEDLVDPRGRGPGSGSSR